jgi:hypothetical protein
MSKGTTTATNSSDQRTFSGYGLTTIDVGAPGEAVRTTSSANGYTTTSGTSFATPLTAGVLALMYSTPCNGLAQLARTNPQGAADAMRTALFAGVEQVGNLPGQTVTGGRINANNSVQYIVNNCATYSPALNVDVKVWLEGAFVPANSTMRDDLRAQGLLPLTEPYSSNGFTLVGNTTPSTTPAVLAVTGNDAIVDWVLLELRSSTTPSQVLASRTALLQRDGDVVATDGSSLVSFGLPAGNYHVAIRHRNHLGAMTAAPVTLSSSAAIIDLRSAAVSLFGTDAMRPIDATRALWSGDAALDDLLKYTGSGNDRDPILTAVGSTTPNNTVPNVYDRRDTNLDGVIKYTGSGNDRDIILTNVGSTTPNNTRTQQLP